MPKVIFIEPGGAQVCVDARTGDSVMRAAMLGGVTGILGECGGSMTCLTCHCYVKLDRPGQIPPPDEDEEASLDCILERRETSRLSCQLVVNPAMEGMRFELPEWQG